MSNDRGSRPSVEPEPPPEAVREPNVRGILVTQQRQLLRDLAGPERYARALNRVPASVRDEYENVSALGWCAQSTARAVTRAVAETIGRSPIDLAGEISEASVMHAFRGVWAVFLKFTSDDALIRRASFIFEKSFDRGKFDAELAGPGRARTVLTGWPHAEDMDTHSIACSIAALLVAAGRRRPRVSVRRDADRILFDVVT